MTPDLNPGWFYTLTVQRHSKLSSDGTFSFSDLEFVEPEHFDESEAVTFIDLEYVGPGYFEWSAEPAPVFLDRSELVKGEGPFYRMFRESEILTVEPTEPG